LRQNDPPSAAAQRLSHQCEQVLQQERMFSTEVENSPARSRLFNERGDPLDNIGDVRWMNYDAAT